MKSKITPSRWWRDYEAECDLFDGIVSRERRFGTTIIKYKDGRVTYDDGRTVMTMGPTVEVKGEAFRTWSSYEIVGPHG